MMSKPGHASTTGKVFLVGAGPGDPDLITVKGRRCIAQADVVVYDYLAAEALLKFAKPECQFLYVGKKGGDHTLTQEQINRLLVDQAKTGKVITRLKGGDPFIFGRGGEEAEVLVQAGIAFEIVPGVTSAIAAPAYAGIPLTHRQFTSTVAFVTGHEDPTKAKSSINWQALAQGVGTLVFLMGVRHLEHIVQQLQTNGCPIDTPAALVRWGTTTRQKTVTGTLDNIVQKAQAANIKAPAIIVVGQVVKLRDTLQWFEKRPLLGKRIVITRARTQASDLIQQLNNLGAECLQCPTIKTVAPDTWHSLDQAIARLQEFEWIVFTSVNGVHFFFERLAFHKMDTRALGHLRTAVIGPATASCLRQFGLNSDIMPKTYQAESVVEAFSQQKMAGSKVLLPRAKEARPVLPHELTRLGAEVCDATAYQTIQITDEGQSLIDHLQNNTIDMITFTSSSTVRNFMALLPQSQVRNLLKDVTIASIGPITADTAAKFGLDVTVIAETYTIQGLCDAIVQYYYE